jgi:hypothetical protein
MKFQLEKVLQNIGKRDEGGLYIIFRSAIGYSLLVAPQEK